MPNTDAKTDSGSRDLVLDTLIVYYSLIDYGSAQFANVTISGSVTISGGITITGGITADSLTLTHPLATSSGGTGLSTVGTAGQILTSNGTSLYYTSPTTGTVSSVSASVPAAFSVTVTNPTTTPAITITYSGTAIPTTSGGTGLTTIGAAGQVLTSNGTGYYFTNPSGGSVTNVASTVPPFLAVNVTNPTTTPSVNITLSGTALPIGSGGTGITTLGTPGQVLTSSGASYYFSTPTTGSVTNVASTVPAFLSVNVTNPTTTPSVDITLSGTALPTTSGGTGLSTVGTTGQVLTSNGTSLYYSTPSYVTPTALITTSTANATGATNNTGALQVCSGGAGIGLDLWVGQNINVVSGFLATDKITNTSSGLDFLMLINNKNTTIASGLPNVPILGFGQTAYSLYPNQIIIATSSIHAGPNPPTPSFPPSDGGNIFIQTGAWCYTSVTSLPALSLATSSPSSYSGQINILSAQTMTIFSNQNMIINASTGINMKTPTALTMTAGGDCSFTSGGAATFTTAGIFTLTGGANIDIISAGVVTVGAYATAVGNVLVESSTSTTINSAGNLYLTTANIIIPPIPVAVGFGNIFIQCATGFGSIVAYASLSGGASFSGGSLGTQIGFTPPGSSIGFTTIKGLEVEITSETGPITLTTHNSVGIQGGGLLINPTSFTITTTFTNGALFGICAPNTTTIYDSSVSTNPLMATAYFGSLTVSSTHGQSTTIATSIYVQGAPIEGLGATFTNKYAIYVNTDLSRFASILATNKITQSFGNIVAGVASASSTTADRFGTALSISYASAGTYLDTLAPASSTIPLITNTHLGITTLSASNTAVTTTAASTLYIVGPPAAGTNMTITNSYSLYISSGPTYFGGAVYITNLTSGIQTIVSAAGVSTFTSATPFATVITGSTTQTIVLPGTGTIPVGTQYSINNNSTGGGVVIQTASLVPITSVPVGGEITLTLRPSLTWDFHFQTPSNTSWGTATLSTSSIIQTSASFFLSSDLSTSIAYSTYLTQNQATNVGNNIIWGQSTTTNNAALMSYVFKGLGSPLSYIGLGLYGADTIRVTASGTSTTSTTTGALIVTGGLGVSGDFYTNIINGTTLFVYNSTTTSGAFTIAALMTPSLTGGGVVNKYMGVSTSTTGDGAVSSFAFTSSGSGSNYFGTSIVGYGFSTKVFASGTIATTSSTGTLVVTGGVGISGALYSATALNITNASTASVTVGSWLAPSLATSTGITRLLGVAATTGNCAAESFVYTSAGSALNYWAVGLYGANTIFAYTAGTASTNTFNGAAVIVGGLGVSGAINAASMTLTAALPINSGGTGITGIGSTGQVLTSNGTSLFWNTPGGGGSVTTVTASVPTFLSVAVGTPSTTPAIAITYSGTALPVLNGGTGATTATGSGSVVLATSPTISTSLIVSTAATTSTVALSLLAPSLIGSGNAVAQVTGQSATTGNSLYGGFVYFGNNSVSNYYGMGLFGANALLIYTAGTAATSKTTGAVQVVGGLGVTGDIYCTNIFGTLSQTLLSVSNATTTTGAFSLGTLLTPSLGNGGSTQIYLGVATSTQNSARLSFGYTSTGSVSNYYGIGFPGSADSLTVYKQGTVSTSSSTGTVLIDGGVGLTGDLYSTGLWSGTNVFASGEIFLSNSTATNVNYMQLLTPNQNTGGGNNIIFGRAVSANNAAVIQYVNAGGPGSTSNYLGMGTFGLNNLTLAGTGVTSVFGSVASTSATTGTLVVTGGVGINGKLYTNNDVHASDIYGNVGLFNNLTTNGGTNTFTYSQGTWTPIIGPDSGSFSTTTYNFHLGAWTKIGNVVTCQIYMDVTASGAPALTPVYVAGLPFSISNATTAEQSWSLSYTSITGSTPPAYARSVATSSLFHMYVGTTNASIGTDAGGSFVCKVTANFTYFT